MRRKGLGVIVNNLALVAVSAAFVVPAILAYEGIKLLTKEKEHSNVSNLVEDKEISLKQFP